MLARWQDDCGEDHDVAQFIGAAEDVGAIGELGRQVLQSALNVWAQLYAAEGSLVPRVSVNVSPVELADAAFAGRVCSMLAAAAVPPSALQIELTDTISPPQIAYVRQTISRMRETGIRVALDGFGSHSANLRSLSDLDIDVVKVDGVMTLAALEGTRSMNLLRSVLDLSGLLGVEVIAKGVETAEQHQLLMLLGCRFGQGFLYSPPLQECEVHPHFALPATRAPLLM